MARFSRTVGVLFLAAASVYPDHVGTALAQSRATPAAAPQAYAAKSSTTDVKLLDAAGTDPFAAATDNAAATQPAADPGKSVSATQVNTDESGAVELHVNDTNLLEVLRMLSLQSQKNIVASKEVKGTVTANLYGVTVNEAIDAVLKQSDLVKVEEGPVIYVYTRKEYAEMQKASRRAATEVFTLHYVPVGDAERMVKNLLSPDGKTVVTAAPKTGVGFDNATAGGDDSANANLLVVTDYEENLVNVRRLVQEVDVRPVQILVEATILRASLTEDNALGVDFTVLGGVDFSTISTNNGLITSANATATGLNGSNSASSGGTGNNFTNSINNGLKLGFVNSNVSIFLSALEETTDTAVLANPKVLVLNKQKGEVKVVRKDPYRGAIVIDVNGQSRQEVETQETGTKLVFRPYVGNDGFIRLEIHPEDSTALPSRASDLPPSQLSTEATTNVLVRDGRTIVIGGLFRESSSTTRSQIPLLGDIPGLGNLFRKKQDNTVREEIIILLTPHVVKDDDAYSRLSEKEQRDAERVRVGVRKGMMPWGRERLAETAYDNAVKELAKPSPNKRKALWHLDCATNLNPKFLEAIDLKERVNGRVVTSVDNSSIRSFVRDAVMANPMASADPLDMGMEVGAFAPTKSRLSLVSPRANDELPASTQPTTAPAPLSTGVAAADDVDVESPTASATPEAVTEDAPAVDEAASVTSTPVDAPTAIVPPGAGEQPELTDVAEVPAVDELPTATVTVTELTGVTEVADGTPATQPAATVSVENAAIADAAPTSQPAAGVKDVPAFQVTELPDADAIPGATDGK